MAKMLDQDIVTLLQSYNSEGETARKSGWGDRDAIWEDNIDLYFNRYDFSNKKDWQAKQAMPEASLYIDRWAAALRSALIVPGVWFSVETIYTELEPAFRKFLAYFLDRCGTNPTGQSTGFSRVFEDQAKLAALMACSASVTWEPRPPSKGGDAFGGRVRVDTVDPREVILDPTGRGLYRRRRQEVDFHQLIAMAKREPSLWDMAEIERLSASRALEEEAEREDLVGHGTRIGGHRKPITLDEYLCDLIDSEGKAAYAGKQLVVIANEKYLIRGPETNPYWHDQDWIVFSPAISVPLSVYGKTYVETWGNIARTFVEMTNLIIDAGMVSAMKAFAVNADMLADPEQIASGIFPNKVFVLEAGSMPDQFIKEINLGELSTAAVTVWTALKQEMREGAATNDMDLGQSVPKGDVTATEINEVRKGGSELIQSIASSLETGCVDPILNLVFQTALQNFGENDIGLRRAIGDEYFAMFVSRREEFVGPSAPAFNARGISSLIERKQKLNSMVQIIQAMGSSPILQQAFLQSIGFTKFVRQLIILTGLDPNEFPPDQLSMMAMQPAAPAASGAPAPAGPRAVARG